jgi:hypothetical protein
MKQKLIEALATKFGVDAKMLEGIAERLSKTVTTDEEVATAVEGVTFQHVLESYADKRANEASETARKNAIKKYEAQFGLKDGKPLEDTANQKEKSDESNKAAEKEAEHAEKPADKPENHHQSKLSDEVAQVLKELKEQNRALSEQVSALNGKIVGFEKKDLAATRRDRLNAAISKLTDKQRKPYAHITLDGMTEDEFESFISEVTSDAEAMVADNAKTAKALEAASHRPTLGNIEVNGKASKDELDKVMKGIH